MTACQICGARYNGQLDFVGFNNRPSGVEDVPAGLIETYEAKPGLTAYRTRDIYAGGTTVVEVDNFQVCSGCLEGGGAEVGLERTAPYQAEIEQLNEQLATMRDELQQSEAQRIENQEALRLLMPVARIVDQEVAAALKRATSKQQRGRKD